MFLNEFSKNEQEIFLNLAYTLMHADNIVSEEEKKTISVISDGSANRHNKCKIGGFHH
jgi:hypothetical protein